MTSDTLARRTSRSVIWMTAQKWVTRVGGLATIVILTRVLAPEDFGLAAAASTLLPLVYVLSDVGFSTYIMQADSVDRRSLSTAFWFSLLSGVVLAGAIIAVAPLVGAMLHLPEVAPILRALTLSVLVIAIGSVPLALMRRRMAFRSLALMELVGSLGAQGIAIAVAFGGGGAWALVLQLMVSQVVTTVWVWLAARWHPNFEFSKPEFAAMSRFGVQVVGSGLVSVVREWVETAIVVAGLGVREMGYLNIAQRLVLVAQDLTASALLPVSMVAFSQVRNSVSRLRSAYLRAVAISYAVVAPLMVFIAVSAPMLIPFLFGADKTDSARVTPALAAVVFINLGVVIDEGLHLGVGRPARWFALVLFSCSVAVGVTALSVRYGLLVMVLAWLGTALAQMVARWFVVGSLIEAPAWRVAVPVLGAVGPTAISALAGLLAFRTLSGLPELLVLAVTGVAVVLTYLVATRVMRRVVLADVLGVLPDAAAGPLRWLLRQPVQPPGPAGTGAEAI